jgi:hypothetical protein
MSVLKSGPRNIRAATLAVAQIEIGIHYNSNLDFQLRCVEAEFINWQVFRYERNSREKAIL